MWRDPHAVRGGNDPGARFTDDRDQPVRTADQLPEFVPMKPAVAFTALMPLERGGRGRLHEPSQRRRNQDVVHGMAPDSQDPIVEAAVSCCPVPLRASSSRDHETRMEKSWLAHYQRDGREGYRSPSVSR